MSAYRMLSLFDAPTTEAVEGLEWLPLRRMLDVEAFGVNAFRAARKGDAVIEEHVESPGQEELYVVVRGAATFTVGADVCEAPAGNALFVRDPGLARKAVAAQDDTVVLAVGGWRGRAYHPLPWEPISLAMPEMRAGDWAAAAETLEREAGPQLETGPVQYRLACLHARAGAEDRALQALRHAILINPDLAERAGADPAFASLNLMQPDRPAAS